MRNGAFDPLALPDAFWARPDIRQALAKQDIGAVLWLVNKRGKIGQLRIGTAVEMSQTRVSQVSRGLQHVKELAVITRIADGLGMPDHARSQLGIGPRHAASPPAGPATDDATGQAAELLRRIASARYIDDSVAQLLQDETENIRQLDRRLGAPAVAAKLTAHIGQLQDSLHHSLTAGSRQRLALVLADAAALAGWQAIDTAQPATAWNHFETATAAAREAGNDALLAFAAGSRLTFCSTSASLPRPSRRSAPSATRPLPPSPASSAAGCTPPKPRWPRPSNCTPTVIQRSTWPHASSASPPPSTCPTSR